MALRLQGKLALVTAAGQGIGRAIAEAFAAEGARVIVTDVDNKKLEGLKSLKRCKLDVRSTASIEALANEVTTELGALEVLVNCAGYVHHGSVLDCSEQDWDFSFDLNVKSMHRTIKAFLRQYFVRRFLDPRGPRPLCLRRHKSRRHRAHQGGCSRFHQERHPGQRHLSRHDRISVAGGADQGPVARDR